MKKCKACGYSEVSREMFPNDVCKGTEWRANGLLMERVCQSRGRGAWCSLAQWSGAQQLPHFNLLNHVVKVIDRVFERRIRKMAEIREEQYEWGIRGTSDAIFISFGGSYKRQHFYILIVNTPS